MTLTNWERLNNAPLPLAGASAVQWNDHVFVLTQDGTIPLYHTKSNIWSVLPNSPYVNYSNTTVPTALTIHNGQILTMSTKGQVATFDQQLCDWTEVNDMNMTMEAQHAQHDCVLVSYNGNLYAIAALQMIRMTRLGQSCLGLPSGIKDCCSIFSYNPNNHPRWTKISEFGQATLQSVAIVGGTAFVHTGGNIYNVSLERGEKKALAQELTGPPPTEIASPPCVGYTLYGIKDTLFSFGGRDRDNQPTSDVLRYNPKTDTWKSAGYMRSARYNVAVTTVQDTTLDVFVVGGNFGSSQHIMKPRAYITSTYSTQTSTPPTWDNKTSILEKCTVN